MKFYLLSLILLTSFSCSSKKISYPDKNICLLLYDLKTNAFTEVHNEQRCHERFPAASTFKIPLAIMAFDSGVFKDELNPVFKWNGEVSKIETWNKDHNPISWMRDSVVWMSQAMTPKIGGAKIQEYLKNFEYGNQDMAAGLKYSWLTPAPFIHEPMQNSLKISGYEQVDFLKKLWRGELLASKTSQEQTKKIMTHDLSPRGNSLIGKTGSGFHDENFQLRLAWFVGYFQTEKTEYVVVVNFSDKQKQPSGTFGGREAKEMALKFLSDKGYW